MEQVEVDAPGEEEETVDTDVEDLIMPSAEVVAKAL